MISKALWAQVLSLLVLGLLGNSAMAAETPYGVLTPADLKARLDQPDVVVVDVRSGDDWQASDQKIKGAVRLDPREAASLSATYSRETTLVLYCA